MIPLVSPTITQEDRDYLRQRLNEGLIDTDEEVGRLEKRFADQLGVRGVVATSSGTTALHLALTAVGVRPESEVILPSYTCIALLHAVRLCGAVPVLVDNAYDLPAGQFNADLADIRSRVTVRTSAIIYPHMFGAVADLRPLADLHVPIIEDITMSIGAGHSLQGVVAICSLHESKMLSAGQGGFVATSEDSLLKEMRNLSHYDEPMGEWRYLNEKALRCSYRMAFSYAMSSLQAALANIQLSRLSQFISRRREIAQAYSAVFQKAHISCPGISPGDNHVFFRYMIETQKPLVAALEALLSKGIQAGRGVYPPLHLLMGSADEGFPNTMQAVRKLLFIPLYPALSDTQVQRITDEVIKVLAS